MKIEITLVSSLEQLNRHCRTIRSVSGLANCQWLVLLPLPLLTDWSAPDQLNDWIFDRCCRLLQRLQSVINSMHSITNKNSILVLADQARRPIGPFEPFAASFLFHPFLSLIFLWIVCSRLLQKAEGMLCVCLHASDCQLPIACPINGND